MMHNLSAERQLESYLHQHIPISKAMGVEVQEASLEKVILTAPFINNINHKQTVFGGSLHAVATLTCWSLLHVNLENLNIKSQIVITESKVDYLLPVDSDFKVECGLPSPEEWERFLKMLRSRKKARIRLSASLYHKDHLSLSYNASFAALC